MKVYPPGSEPYVTLKRLDGFIGENMPHSVAQTICGWWPAPGSPRSEIDRIRARMMARQLEYERKKRITAAR